MPDDLLRIEMAHFMNIRPKEQRLEPQRRVYSLGYRKLNEILQKRAAFARARAQTNENAMEGLPIPTLVVVGRRVEKSFLNIGINIFQLTLRAKESWQARILHAEDPKENMRPRNRHHAAHQASVADIYPRRSIEHS